MNAFTNLDEIAVYLQAAVIAGEPSRIAWRRTPSSPVVDIYWDDERRLVWLRAPLDIDAAHLDQRDLALAIAAINIKLEVLGIEYDTQPMFVSHVFFDADGKVSQRAIERLLLAVDHCVARTASMTAVLAPRKGQE
jgi:hypothetical protein